MCLQGELHLKSLIEGECWYPSSAKRMCMAPKTHGISHPLLRVSFSCFACLKQTTTSVFSSCFVCRLKRKKKVVASVKNNCIGFSLLDPLDYNGQVISQKTTKEKRNNWDEYRVIEWELWKEKKHQNVWQCTHTHWNRDGYNFSGSGNNKTFLYGWKRLRFTQWIHISETFRGNNYTLLSLHHTQKLLPTQD